MKKGFTLIELLVTIVIVGILAAVNISSFQSYTPKARDAKNQALIDEMVGIIKAEGLARNDGKYIDFDGDADNTDIIEELTTIFAQNGFRVPESYNDYCFYYGVRNGMTGIDSSLPTGAGPTSWSGYERFFGATGEDFYIKAVRESSIEESFYTGGTGAPTTIYNFQFIAGGTRLGQAVAMGKYIAEEVTVTGNTYLAYSATGNLIGYQRFSSWGNKPTCRFVFSEGTPGFGAGTGYNGFWVYPINP